MGRRKGGPLLNTNAAMRNWPSETRKMVVFSYDWLHTALLACVRSKQLVPSGCGSNRVYHGCRVSTSSAASCTGWEGWRQGRRGDAQEWVSGQPSGFPEPTPAAFTAGKPTCKHPRSRFTRPLASAPHLEERAGGELQHDGQPDAKAHEARGRARLGQPLGGVREAHHAGQHRGVQQVLQQVLRQGVGVRREGGLGRCKAAAVLALGGSS